VSAWSEQIGRLIGVREWTVALAEIDARIAQEPHATEAWVMKSQVFLQTDRLAESMTAVECALRLDDAFAPAYYQLAYLLHLQGRMDDAVVQYARAFSLHPVLDDSLGWCQLMIACGQYGLAKPLAVYWTTGQPDVAEGWFLYGTIQLVLHEPAVDALLKAWTLDPDIADLPNNLGRAYLEQQDWTEAERWFDIALTRRPDDLRALKNRKLLHNRQQSLRDH